MRESTDCDWLLASGLHFRRFPFMYIWEGRLKDIYEEYKKQSAAVAILGHNSAGTDGKTKVLHHCCPS